MPFETSPGPLTTLCRCLDIRMRAKRQLLTDLEKQRHRMTTSRDRRG
jgi:hypothetical protein